jgi:hypothetical protein
MVSWTMSTGARIMGLPGSLNWDRWSTDLWIRSNRAKGYDNSNCDHWFLHGRWGVTLAGGVAQPMVACRGVVKSSLELRFQVLWGTTAWSSQPKMMHRPWMC